MMGYGLRKFASRYLALLLAIIAPCYVIPRINPTLRSTFHSWLLTVDDSVTPVSLLRNTCTLWHIPQGRKRNLTHIPHVLLVLFFLNGRRVSHVAELIILVHLGPAIGTADLTRSCAIVSREIILTVIKLYLGTYYTSQIQKDHQK